MKNIALARKAKPDSMQAPAPSASTGYRWVDEDRILFWTKHRNHKNFGDYLGSYITKRVALYPAHDADLYHMIGSVIDPLVLAATLQFLPTDARIAYWCCGCRSDTPLTGAHRQNVLICGVRGPLSRAALGLPNDTPLGDPALLLPLLYQPRRSERTAGLTVCIPHALQDFAAERLRAEAGADVALSTWVDDDTSLHRLIDDIHSASFVLSGSLHGAIVAHAYGKPYAYWQADGIDVPFKWADFAALVGRESRFARTLAEGLALHAAEAEKAPTDVPLAPILCCAPFTPRANILARAIASDTDLPPLARDAMLVAADAAAATAERTREALGARARPFSRHVSIGRSAWARAGEELANVAEAMRETAHALSSRAAALMLRISRLNPALDFTQDGAAQTLLTRGWGEPGGMAPWSLAPEAQILIPSQFGWEDAERFRISGLLFAPHAGATPGQRRLSIWINGELVIDAPYRNLAPAQSTPLDVMLPVPRHLKLVGAPLAITISCDPVGSLAELGLGADTRQIGMAVSTIEFFFAADTAASS